MVSSRDVITKVGTMSDDIQGNDSVASESKDSELFNYKKEVERKLSNSESQIDILKRSNEELTSYVRNLMSQQQAPKKEEAPLRDLILDNPDRAVEIIETRVRDSLKSEQSEQNRFQAKSQAAVQQLVQEFPELSSQDHELTKAAVAIYNRYLKEGEAPNPALYKAAVYEAAAEQGVLPNKKREKSRSSEDFSLSGKGSSGKQPKEAKRDDATSEFARMLSQNDPALAARLKKKGIV